MFQTPRNSQQRRNTQIYVLCTVVQVERIIKIYFILPPRHHSMTWLAKERRKKKRIHIERGYHTMEKAAQENHFCSRFFFDILLRRNTII